MNARAAPIIRLPEVAASRTMQSLNLLTAMPRGGADPC
jgi:hypothetical protein